MSRKFSQQKLTRKTTKTANDNSDEKGEFEEMEEDSIIHDLEAVQYNKSGQLMIKKRGEQNPDRVWIVCRGFLGIFSKMRN